MLGGWGKFALAVLGWISVFALAYGVLLLNLVDISGAKIATVWAYSAVNFVTVGTSPEDWLTGVGIVNSPWLPAIVLDENIWAVIHWGLGLAQAYLWLSRR